MGKTINLNICRTMTDWPFAVQICRKWKFNPKKKKKSILDCQKEAARGRLPTTSSITQSNASLVDEVNISPPTRTRVMLGWRHDCWATLNNPQNSMVAAVVLLDRWFVCKQRIFL